MLEDDLERTTFFDFVPVLAVLFFLIATPDPSDGPEAEVGDR
jgi:hypothetical protein